MFTLSIICLSGKLLLITRSRSVAEIFMAVTLNKQFPISLQNESNQYCFCVVHEFPMTDHSFPLNVISNNDGQCGMTTIGVWIGLVRIAHSFIKVMD